MKKIRLIDIIVTLFWFSQYVHMPYQTPFLSEIGITATLIGVIVGFYGMMQMFCRIPLGVYSDLRSKVKPFIILGTALTTCGSLCRSLFPTGTGFLIANVFSGLASTTWISFVVCGTSGCPKDKMDSAGAQLIFFNNLGILFGFLFGLFFIDRLGLQRLCVCGAVIGLISFILSFRITETGTLTPASSGRSVRSILQRAFAYPKMIRCALAAFIQGGLVTATASSFTTQVLRDRGASSLLLGLASVVYILSAVLSSKLDGSDLHHRLGFRKSSAILFLILAVYCVLVPVLPSTWMIICCQVLVGLGQGWLNAMLMSEGQQNIPEEIHSTTMGIHCAFAAAGMFLVPLLVGKISDLRGMTTAYMILAGVTVFTALVFVFSKNKTQGEEHSA